ncbi:MAG: hypothetical protein OEL76_13360 [Siculibacillus sp.]|nr:hypothetical protein [Siculibacillus sp.]
MLPLVLRRLEALEADLAAIDPSAEADAADRIASMAVVLRDVLADFGLTEAVGDGAATGLAVRL